MEKKHVEHCCWLPQEAKCEEDEQWAFETCHEYNGELYVSDGNCARNQVNYCPICGYKAKVQIKENEDAV